MKTTHALIVSAAVVIAGLAAWTLVPSQQSDPIDPGQIDASIGPSPAANTHVGAKGSADDLAAGLAVSPLEAGETATAPHTAQPGKRLAGSTFEASFLTGGLINEHALKLLEAKDFGSVIAQLDAQNAGARNTLTDQYRAQIENTLAAFENSGRVDRFACGVNVCLVSITDQKPGYWFNDWYDNVQSAVTLPIGAISMFDTTGQGGMTEHRILFTTHPDSGGFFVKPHPR